MSDLPVLTLRLPVCDLRMGYWLQPRLHSRRRAYSAADDRGTWSVGEFEHSRSLSTEEELHGNPFKYPYAAMLWFVYRAYFILYPDISGWNYSQQQNTTNIIAF